jgi:hypothetical protein
MVKRWVYSATQRDGERRWIKDVLADAFIQELGAFLQNSSYTLCELSSNILNAYDALPNYKLVIDLSNTLSRRPLDVEKHANQTARVASQE